MTKNMILMVVMCMIAICAVGVFATPEAVTLIVPLNATNSSTAGALGTNYNFTANGSDSWLTCGLTIGTSLTSGTRLSNRTIANNTVGNLSNVALTVDGNWYWWYECNDTDARWLNSSKYLLRRDSTGPPEVNITISAFTEATPDTAGLYGFCADVRDALNTVSTAHVIVDSTSHSMTATGTGNQYCANVTVAQGSKVYYFSSNDSLNNIAATAPAVYKFGSLTQQCDATKAVIYAAFVLISLFVVVGAAFALVKFDGIASLQAISFTAIAVAIIVFVGYVVVSQIAAIVC